MQWMVSRLMQAYTYSPAACMAFHVCLSVMWWRCLVHVVIILSTGSIFRTKTQAAYLSIDFPRVEIVVDHLLQQKQLHCIFSMDAVVCRLLQLQLKTDVICCCSLGLDSPRRCLACWSCLRDIPHRIQLGFRGVYNVSKSTWSWRVWFVALTE